MSELEVLKSKFKVLENQLDEKKKEAEKAVELQKKYKTEMKCLDTKVKKIKTESQGFKSEK
jgi:chromosome segregation ATPase